MLTAVILISGAGTNMLALADNLPDGVRIAAVGADRDAPGLAGAQQRGIPVFVHERRDGQSRQAWAAGLQDRIDQFEPDIVVPMSPEDWRKLLVKRAKSEGATIEEGEDESGEFRDVQLDRAVDVLKGVMIFQTQNDHQMMASSGSPAGDRVE